MKLLSPEEYRAALYCRLSRDEDTKQESNSITNQRRILEDYAMQNGYPVHDIYVDDGWSGTSFDRPDFQRMMEDINAGNINMVIVKDLSRLGREYIATGQYIEQIFPQLDIRFISLGESFDSLYDDEPSADMVPMVNLFNEYHAKNTSKKSRAAKTSMASAGMFIGSKAPFGYRIDPQNKHHLLVDPEAADVVRRIFQYACDGLGYKAIAKRLLESKVPNPSAYAGLSLSTSHRSEVWRGAHDWHPSSIKTILTNPTYLGKIVSGRRKTKSFKCKDIEYLPEEDWIVVDNMHETIIDQRTWDTAQEKLKFRKRMDNQGIIQIFAGLLKCADCGYALAYTRSGGARYYQCSQYNVKGKTYCSSHFIRYDELYDVVLYDIQRRAKAAAGMDKQMLKTLKQEAAVLLDKTLKQAETEFESIDNRITELDTIIEKLYEDHALDRISDQRFEGMMQKYEVEQVELKRRHVVAHKELSEQQKSKRENEQFAEAIAAYKDITALNASILNELVQSIEVGSIQMKDGVKHRNIRIRYRQFCYVEILTQDAMFSSSQEEAV